MVERPIKKSERQQMAEAPASESQTETQPSGNKERPIRNRDRGEQNGGGRSDRSDRSDRNDRSNRSDRGERNDRGERGGRNERGRGKGRGKGKERDVEKPPVNMALLRGPKPAKPQAPIEESPAEEPLEATEEITAEEAAVEEATEA